MLGLIPVMVFIALLVIPLIKKFMAIPVAVHSLSWEHVLIVREPTPNGCDEVDRDSITGYITKGGVPIERAWPAVSVRYHTSICPPEWWGRYTVWFSVLDGDRKGKQNMVRVSEQEFEKLRVGDRRNGVITDAGDLVLQ